MYKILICFALSMLSISCFNQSENQNTNGSNPGGGGGGGNNATEATFDNSLFGGPDVFGP